MSRLQKTFASGFIFLRVLFLEKFYQPGFFTGGCSFFEHSSFNGLINRLIGPGKQFQGLFSFSF